MEGAVRSGGVLKKKSSSGCLIIKKKVENGNSGLVGLSMNNSKEKKRPRFIGSDSNASNDDDNESLEFTRRKANGSVGYYNSDRMHIDSERKRGRLDSYDFDEYGDFNGKRMRNEYVDERFRAGGHNNYSENLNSKNFGVGLSRRNLMADKQTHSSYFDGSSSERRNNVGDYLEEDETQMPIRLQGKNGVLKLMVNKKKKMNLHSHQHRKYDPRENVFPKKDLSSPLPEHQSLKPPENRGFLVDKEKIGLKLEKKVKPVLGKVVKAREMETDVSDTALKLAPPGAQACSSKKGTKKEEEKTPSENVKGKAKRGGSTEKQMLREKIRGMLLESGWTIDYRPRRNRDYLDAVYINPSGTAYWSIIKAYDALKKQLDEDSIKKARIEVGPASFAPLSEDLINKLTRQTKKKIEDDLKRKRKEDGLAKTVKKYNVRDSGESLDNDFNLRKGKSLEVDQDSDDDVSDDSPKRMPRQFNVGKPVLQGRTSKVIGRCTLLVRGSDGYVPYSGKRTLLAWLIDSGTAHLSDKVQYMNRKRNRVMLEGWITRDGIHCGCCSKILTVSKFELHAGSKLRQPFQNIFLESGVSLLQCQLDAWNKQGESVRRDYHTVDVDGDDPDDDTCGLCGDGGALICCDSCPSTFHQLCLEIKMLPSGDWHCPNCVCKFCGDAAEGNDNAADELTRCGFCEKKYHESCSAEVHAVPMSSSDVPFCGPKCQELYDHLQKILGAKHELEAGFSWSIIQRADVTDSLFPQRVECNSKLAVALSVMDECFLPITDRRSGFNMIHNVVYNCGSNFNRLNYRGFYTAILERGDEIVSAASIRIHGTCLAEMPFIATREIYRRQGMCRRLLSAIETELRFLKVEKLIIPAISEHRNTWTAAFGFRPLEDGVKKEIKSINMLVFPGTDMLQKLLVNQEFSGVISVKISESIKKQPQSHALVEKSENESSMEERSKECHDNKTNDQVNDLDSASHDYSAASTASDSTVAAKPELENKQNETSACSKYPFTNNISKIENGLLENVNSSDEPVSFNKADNQLQNDLIAPCFVPEVEESANPVETDKPDSEKPSH